MQAGDICWWKQCFKGIFACVSVSATAKTNRLSYFDKLWQKARHDLYTVAKSGV